MEFPCSSFLNQTLSRCRIKLTPPGFSMASGLISDGKLNAANSQLETIGWGGGPSSKTLPLDLVKQLGNRNAPGQGYGSFDFVVPPPFSRY